MRQICCKVCWLGALYAGCDIIISECYQVASSICTGVHIVSQMVWTHCREHLLSVPGSYKWQQQQKTPNEAMQRRLGMMRKPCGLPWLHPAHWTTGLWVFCKIFDVFSKFGIDIAMTFRCRLWQSNEYIDSRIIHKIGMFPSCSPARQLQFRAWPKYVIISFNYLTDVLNFPCVPAQVA